MAEEKVLSHSELEQAMKTAASKGDWKAVREAAKKLEEQEKAQAAAEKEAKLQALVGTTKKVAKAIYKTVNAMVENKELDVADGVWFVWDFGETIADGINPSCRLIKTAPHKARGTGSGSGSYISRPEKSSDLLAQVGSHIMFKEATSVTIDKVEQTMPAGMTFQKAYDFSTNGGWRNRVRMALLKEAGLV